MTEFTFSINECICTNILQNYKSIFVFFNHNIANYNVPNREYSFSQYGFDAHNSTINVFYSILNWSQFLDDIITQAIFEGGGGGGGGSFGGTFQEEP